MDTDAVRKILRRLSALVHEDIRKGEVGIRAYQRLAQRFDEGPQKARQDFGRLFGDEAVPESRLDAWRAGEPGIIRDDKYHERWGSVIENSAVGLEAVGEDCLARRLRDMTPEPLVDPGDEDIDATWSFDIYALRDCVVAILRDLAEDQGVLHGLETGGTSGEPDQPQLQMTQEDPQLIAATANADVSVQLLSIFTNGLSDQRFEQAAKVAGDKSKTVAEKLDEIDKLTPFPPTASAQKLADVLGCSKPAIINSPWWQQNRAGKSKEKQREREIKHSERAKRHE